MNSISLVGKMHKLNMNEGMNEKALFTCEGSLAEDKNPLLKGHTIK